MLMNMAVLLPWAAGPRVGHGGKAVVLYPRRSGLSRQCRPGGLSRLAPGLAEARLARTQAEGPISSYSDEREGCMTLARAGSVAGEMCGAHQRCHRRAVRRARQAWRLPGMPERRGAGG